MKAAPAASAETIGTTSTSVNSEASTPTHQGKRKVQLRAKMERSNAYRGLPSGAWRVLTAMWELADSPRGSEPWVHGRCKVRTIADRTGLSIAQVGRWLRRLRVLDPGQEEPTGWLGGWLDTHVSAGRYLTWTIYADPDGGMGTPIEAPEHDHGCATRSSVDARPGSASMREELAHPCATDIPRQRTTSSPPPPPTSSSDSTAEAASAAVGDAGAEAQTHAGGGGGVRIIVNAEPRTPAGAKTLESAGAAPASSYNREVHAFVGMVGATGQVVQELAQSPLLASVTQEELRATWQAVQTTPGVRSHIGLFVKRLRAGELTSPKAARPIDPPPPTIDATDVLVGDERRRAFDQARRAIAEAPRRAPLHATDPRDQLRRLQQLRSESSSLQAVQDCSTEAESVEAGAPEDRAQVEASRPTGRTLAALGA